MPLLSVTVKGLENVQQLYGTQVLSVALRKTFNQALFALQHDIRKGVAQIYAAPYDAARVVTVRKATDTHPEASINYAYKPISLAMFPVKQVRITVGGKKLKVTRERGHAPFRRMILNRRAITYTSVMVKRAGGYKVVQGKLGYKGWLHTGLRHAYSAQVFERNQQPTWYQGERLPFHRLLGPSISQMVASPEIQRIIEDSPYFRDITNILLSNLGPDWS